MALYLLQNGAAGTTAAPVAVTTGTAIKTMLQFKPSATVIARIVEWGISFDGAAAAAGIKCELIETDVAATVTAHVTAGIVRLNADAADTISKIVLETATTTITERGATRLDDQTSDASMEQRKKEGYF